MIMEGGGGGSDGLCPLSQIVGGYVKESNIFHYSCCKHHLFAFTPLQNPQFQTGESSQTY